MLTWLAWLACLLMSQPAAGISVSRRRIWQSRLGLVLLLSVMFGATWASWPDLVVDCGRELYVPAELAAGKALYHDVTYHFGPLGPSVNAVLFRLFGIHLTVLYIAGFLTALSTVLVLHAIALRFLTAMPAFIAASVYGVQLFQPSWMNGILPYSFSATYGSLSALVCAWFLMRFASTFRPSYTVWASVAAALAMLAKWEYGGAAYTAYALSCMVVAWNRKSWRMLAVPALAGALSVSAVVAILAAYIYPDTLPNIIATNWVSLPGSHFMRVYGPAWVAAMGLRFSATEMVKVLLFGLLFLASWAIAAATTVRCLRRAKWWLVIPPAALFVWATAVKPSANPQIYSVLHHLFYPPTMFYLTALVALISLILAIARNPALPLEVLPVAFMAVAIGIRVMNYVSFSGYPIYYSPLLVVFLYFWLCATMRYFASEYRPGFRARVVGILLAVQTAGAALLIWQQCYSGLPGLTHVVESSRGKVRTSESRARFLNEISRFVANSKARGESVLLLPELTGLYFMTGTSAPSRYYVLTPGELTPGPITDAYLKELERNPPSAILLTNRRTSEYGVDYFGIDYDQAVLAWIESRYQAVGEIGQFSRRKGAPDGALIYRPMQ